MDRMAQTNPPEDLMQYEAMAQDALRGVVKAALKKAAAPGGLPEPHHLYITFKTQAAGVSGPQDLLGKYPDEMTIILQHQYWDLAPGETFFSVTLKFGGQPKRLSVPYAARDPVLRPFGAVRPAVRGPRDRAAGARARAGTRGRRHHRGRRGGPEDHLPRPVPQEIAA
jgi:hypothetical protein